MYLNGVPVYTIMLLDKDVSEMAKCMAGRAPNQGRLVNTADGIDDITVHHIQQASCTHLYAMVPIWILSSTNVAGALALHVLPF